MGLNVSIFKSEGREFSNGGLSSRVDRLTIVNASGPSEPSDDAPAALVVAGAYPGIAKVVEAEGFDEGWRERYDADRVGPMMGGCYVSTSDSRFGEVVESIVGGRFYGAVALHDRYENGSQD